MTITLLDMKKPSDVKKLYEEFNKSFMECYSHELECYKEHHCNYSCNIMDNNDFDCCSLIHLVCNNYYKIDFNTIRFIEINQTNDITMFQFFTIAV